MAAIMHSMFPTVFEAEWSKREHERVGLRPLAILGLFKRTIRKAAHSLAAAPKETNPILAEEKLHYTMAAIRARDQKDWVRYKKRLWMIFRTHQEDPFLPSLSTWERSKRLCCGTGV